MPTIYGIDLGAHSVKLSMFEGSFGRYQFKGVRSRPVPQSDESSTDTERRLSALAVLLADLETERSVAVSTYPAESTSIRVVRLPFGDRAQVEKTLPFEVEAQVPFDLDETCLASRVLSVEPGESRVLAAIAPTKAVAERVNALKSLNVEPTALALDSDLIGNYGDSGVQAVIDFGHSRTLATLVMDGKTQISRAISMGGRDLTQALAYNRGLSFEEAEELKHRTAIAENGVAIPAPVHDEDDEEEAPDLAEEEIDTQTGANAPVLSDTEALLRALQPQLNNLRATLISFEDTAQVEIDEVLICGGGADLQGLREHLTEELGVPIRRVHISNEVDDISMALAHAVGMRGAKLTHGRELDMRQGDIAFQGDLAALGTVLKYGSLAAAVLMAVGVGWFVMRYTQLNQELAQVEQQFAEAIQESFPELGSGAANMPKKAMTDAKQITNDAVSRVESLGSILSKEPPTLTLYQKISEGMPPHTQTRIDVREMTISKTSITFKAETDGYEEATSIESGLQKVQGFTGAKKGDEKRDRDGNVDFSVSIPLGETDTEEG
ncbi:MAG: pilus assembly protein PilM [Myxococcota bacterium]